MAAVVLFSVILQFFIGIVVSSGDFIVVSSPNCVKFVKDADAIDTNEIAPLILASLGFPLKNDLNWNGMEEVNLFQRPKATAVISVESVADDRLNINGIAKYKTVENNGNLYTGDIERMIETIDWSTSPLTVNFHVQDNFVSVQSGRSELFNSLPLTLSDLRSEIANGNVDDWFTSAQLASLNVSNDAEFTFLGELYTMQQVVKNLVDNKNSIRTKSPDFFHFSISGLYPVGANYGFNSVQYNDALNLLQTSIAQVSGALRELYSDNVLIEVVTFSPEAADKPHSRRVRRAATAAPAVSTGSLNLASNYTANYSALFNIFLWVSIIFAIVVFYIAWAIWFMDPGRDSIIYRMTSTRMKRD